MEVAQQTRVRLNVSLTAKGYGQWECTSEFPDLEQASRNLSAAIDSVRAILAEKGIPEAGKETK